MLSWVFVVVLVSLLSYLADVGVLPQLRRTVPFLGGSVISVALMATCILMLLRITKMSKHGEKEMLREWVSELERELELAKKAPGSRKKPSSEPKKDDGKDKDPTPT